MIVVIQCAAGKRPNAGRLVSSSGIPVEFVADPAAAPTSGQRYARPDDPVEGGGTWRDQLVAYNRDPQGNRLGLLPAYQLYENPVYRRLVDRLGANQVYILSAGWGLISAGFLTPYYDITFSPSAEPHKRRRKSDRCQDFRMLPVDPGGDVVFLGGKDYLPLFQDLTDSVTGRRIVLYNSAVPPRADGCTLLRFETTTRTNWHYQAAAVLLDGEIGLRLSRTQS